MAPLIAAGSTSLPEPDNYQERKEAESKGTTERNLQIWSRGEEGADRSATC